MLQAVDELEGEHVERRRDQPTHYSFRVTWSPEDEEFIATCVEFPSLSWLAATPSRPSAGLRSVVKETVADMRASGEEVPVPLASRHY